MLEELQQLIDQRYQNERTIEKLTAENKKLGSQIAAILVDQGVDGAFGTQGIGYRLSNAAPRYEYRQAAIDYIDSLGLSKPLVKITRKALDDLMKQGQLTYADMAEIDKHTVVTEGEITIRKVVDKEFAIV